MTSILTLTMNPALDLFLESPPLKPNEKLRCGPPLYAAGGGGINVSRAISHLQGESTALFPAGGAAGNRLIELLASELIATSVVPIAGDTRQNVNVIEEKTRLEYRFVVPGPRLEEKEWQGVLESIRSAHRPDYIVASGSLPPGVPVDFYALLALLAHELGVRLIVDTSGEPLRHAGGKGTYLIKPSVAELMMVAGEGADLEVAAAQFVETGLCEVVVVSAGGGGAIIADHRGTQRIPAPVVSIGSRVGAGDSMVAGITIGLSRGYPLDEAVMFGIAAGSAAVMTRRHELCRFEDTEKLFKQLSHSRRGSGELF